MPVKYTITEKKYDNTERGDSPVEKILGIIWNLQDDTIIFQDLIYLMEKMNPMKIFLRE